METGPSPSSPGSGERTLRLRPGGQRGATRMCACCPWLPCVAMPSCYPGRPLRPAPTAPLYCPVLSFGQPVAGDRAMICMVRQMNGARSDRALRRSLLLPGDQIADLIAVGTLKPGVSCRMIVAFSHAPTAGGIWPRASRRQHPARSIPIWLLQVSVSASHACTTRSGQPPAHTTFDDAYPSAGSMSLGGM